MAPTSAATSPRAVMQGPHAADMGVAFNPQTGEREQVSRGEATSKGFQNFTKASEAEFDRYRSSQVMFNDVQSNVSRYTTAVQRYAKEGRPSDGALFDTIINKSGIAELALKISAGGDIQVPILTAFGEAVSREARSSAYKNLSPAGKSVVDGYFRTMAAVPAYQKALTTIGKLNKETIDLELANIPNPTMAPDDQARKLAAFQENVNQGAAGLPRIKGVPTLQETRDKFEGTATPIKRPNVNFEIPAPFAKGIFSQLGGQ